MANDLQDMSNLIEDAFKLITIAFKRIGDLEERLTKIDGGAPIDYLYKLPE